MPHTKPPCEFIMQKKSCKGGHPHEEVLSTGYTSVFCDKGQKLKPIVCFFIGTQTDAGGDGGASALCCYWSFSLLCKAWHARNKVGTCINVVSSLLSKKNTSWSYWTAFPTAANISSSTVAHHQRAWWTTAIAANALLSPEQLCTTLVNHTLM